MITELIKVYNESNKSKSKFFKLAYKRTGIRKQAFAQGELKDLIQTLIFDVSK